MRTGHCLCGSVTYAIVGHCHCRDCPRVMGAGHGTGATFSASDVEVRGTVTEFTALSEAGNTVSHLFFPTCSSSLSGRNTGMPGFITITAGTLDEPDTLEAQATVFARNRCRWDWMDPSVTAYEAQPNWKPE